jgi:hypothetical protein
MTRGMSVKFPRTRARSASREALSASEPQVVLPQALKMKSSVVCVSMFKVEENGQAVYMVSSNDTGCPMGS